MELVDVNGRSLRKITGDEFIQKIVSGERYLENILLENENLNQHPRFAEFNQYLRENTLGGNSLVLSWAYLRQVQAKGIYLPYLTGNYLTLRDVNLEGACLTGADLKHAHFSGAILRGADLREAYLQSIFLNEADFSWAVLEKADLTGASTRTNYPPEGSEEEILWSIRSMETEELNETVFSSKERLSINAVRIKLRENGCSESGLAYLVDEHKKFILRKRETDSGKTYPVESGLFEGTNVSFARANLNEARLVGSYLGGVNFNGASLRYAIVHDDSNELHRVDSDPDEFPMMLSYADFRAADLTGAVIVGVDAEGVDFRGAKFGDTLLDHTYLRDSDFKDAKMVKVTDFGHADIRGIKNLEHCKGLIKNGRFGYTVVTEKEKNIIEDMLRKEGKRLMSTRWRVVK